MAIAITTSEKDYILKDDLKLSKEKQTTFKIKPLSANQHAALQDNLIYIEGEKDIKFKNMFINSLDALKCGLTGWSNFKDEDGNDVPFEKDMDKNVDKISIKDRDELANKIGELSILKKEQSKN